ncbi:hypothetical protein MHYP_G00269010 [Metynnis hypsauchen]
MVSIVRATTTEFMYPSKNDVQAMAKRLVEYYPMLRDNSVNCKHTWELLFKQLMKSFHNIKTPKKQQGPTSQRQRKQRRLDFECFDGDLSTSISESPGSTASTVILDIIIIIIIFGWQEFTLWLWMNFAVSLTDLTLTLFLT